MHRYGWVSLVPRLLVPTESLGMRLWYGKAENDWSKGIQRSEFTYLALVHQVTVKDDLNRARELSCWSFLWHLLDTECLVISVDRQAKLCF